MKNNMDQMAHLEMHNIKVLSNIKMKSWAKQSKNPSENRDKCKAHNLVVVTYTYSTWVLDSGASYHMDSSKDIFTPMDPSNYPPVLIEDDI